MAASTPDPTKDRVTKEHALSASRLAPTGKSGHCRQVRRLSRPLCLRAAEDQVLETSTHNALNGPFGGDDQLRFPNRLKLRAESFV